MSAQVTQTSLGAESADAAIAALAGKVLGPNGRPLAGIRVELDEAGTAIPVTSTFTQQDGTFELYNIPKGTYEAIAESGDSQVSDAVALQAGEPALELRCPTSATDYNTDSTISVARILVPQKAQKIYRQARQAFNQGKNDEAEKLLDDALLIEPEFADALTLRGYIEMQNDEIQAAEQYLERAVRIDPNSPTPYVALGAVYNREGRFDDALHASERGTTLSPRLWQGYFEMARAAVGKGMYRKALLLVRQAERLGGSSFASFAPGEGLRPVSAETLQRRSLRVAGSFVARAKGNKR